LAVLTADGELVGTHLLAGRVYSLHSTGDVLFMRYRETLFRFGNVGEPALFETTYFNRYLLRVTASEQLVMADGITTFADLVAGRPTKNLEPDQELMEDDSLLYTSRCLGFMLWKDALYHTADCSVVAGTLLLNAGTDAPRRAGKHAIEFHGYVTADLQYCTSMARGGYFRVSSLRGDRVASVRALLLK